MYKLSDIKHETRSFFVLCVGAKGFQVLRRDPTAATVVAHIGVGTGRGLGLDRAIDECERRQVFADADFDAQAAKCKRPSLQREQAAKIVEPKVGEYTNCDSCDVNQATHETAWGGVRCDECREKAEARQ